MNTTTIKGLLRAAVFTGAIGVLPQAALADSGGEPTGAETSESVPDHATAESRGSEDTSIPNEEATSRAPDHQAAQARGAGDTTISGEEAATSAPNHATAERRGADTTE